MIFKRKLIKYNYSYILRIKFKRKVLFLQVFKRQCRLQFRFVYLTAGLKRVGQLGLYPPGPDQIHYFLLKFYFVPYYMCQ